MIKTSMHLFFIFLSAVFIRVSAQDTITYQMQDSLISHVQMVNGTAEIKNLSLFPETTAIENLFLEVNLNAFTNNEKFIQNPIRIELDREVNGKVERIEIARFFLPWLKKESTNKSLFVFDISVYSPLFQENVDLFLISSNPSQNPEFDLHFKWKLGEPPTKVNQIIVLWRSEISGFSYADKKNPINDQIAEKSITISADIKYALLKIYLSGRSLENNMPTEEDCSKFYFLNVNEQTVAKRPVWHDDCSLNAFFPQEGPWTYSRPNWCPGQALRVFDHFIPLGADTTLHIDLHLQEATKENPILRDFILSANLILFEKAQAENDAAIVEILAPNKSVDHNRYNPICSSPVIRVRNTGSDTLRTVLIGYGLNFQNDNRYRWRGELAFMEEEIVYLPPLNWYFNGNKNDSTEFCVSIEEVNQKVDEYESNNNISTVLHLAPVYPNKISIQYLSPQAAVDNIIELVDDMGIPLFEADDFVNDSVYNFDLELLPGCYEFIVYDQQANGINFPNNKNGSLKIIDFKSKKELKDFEPNFGAEIRQQFMILK